MRKIETEVIYQDAERTLLLTGGGFLIAESKRGRKEADLAHANTTKTLPAGSDVALRKIGERAANWYTLTVWGSPVALLPDASKAAVDAAIEQAKTWAQEREAVKAAELQARDDAARQACPTGFVLARQNWSNGDLCAAQYQTDDGIKVLASDLLESHNGWYYLPVDAVDAARAKEEEQAAAVTARQVALETARMAKRAEAEATGKPVVVDTWVAETCTANLSDCSFDAATEYALPDGTTKIEYRHCH